MKRDRWKNSQKAAFLMNLGVLLEQGYPLSSAIELLILYEKDFVQERLQQMLAKLKEGILLSHVLHHFPKDIQAYIYFSERNGDITTGLKEAGKMLLKREELKEKFQKLLRYPIFLLWVIIMIFLLMNYMLFPHFVALFNSFNGELPFITTFLLIVIDFLPIVFFAITFSIIAAFLIYKGWLSKFPPHKKIKLLLKIPHLSWFVSSIITYYFVVQLSGLLKGGMSIHDALSVFEEQENLKFYQEEGRQLKYGLQQGEDLAVLVNNRNYFTKELALIISHGQNKGDLDTDLVHYSEVLFQTIENRVQTTIMLVQPTLFVFIGATVFLMFLSVFLPVFQLINSLE